MEAAAIDPHQLVRLDAKSAPRARSFRERTEVRLLCVSDACALDARCALVPDHEHASANVDEVIRQEHVGSDVPASFLVPLDALGSRGKDDCLRTPPLCARVSKQLGSSKVFSGLSVNVDFLVGESDDLLAAEQSMHLEGKTKNNAREREIATCAAVGAEIPTCIRWWVQAVAA